MKSSQSGGSFNDSRFLPFVPSLSADCLYETDIPADVQYKHVQLVAKELPPLAFVREVAAAANEFWAQHPDQYIAIHCAYGARVVCWLKTGWDMGGTCGDTDALHAEVRIAGRESWVL